MTPGIKIDVYLGSWFSATQAVTTGPAVLTFAEPSHPSLGIGPGSFT